MARGLVRCATFCSIGLAALCVEATQAQSVDLCPGSGGVWVDEPDMPTGRSGLFRGNAAIGGEAYAVGGGNHLSLTAAVEAFDVASNAWITKAPLPFPRMDGAIAVVGGKLYAIGGQRFLTEPADRTVHIYDPTENTWTEGAPMPTARRSLAAAVVGDLIFTFSGVDVANKLSHINEVYDTVHDTWSTRAPVPVRNQYVNAEAVNGRIYVFGGNGDFRLPENDPRRVFEYDPQHDSWTEKTPAPGIFFALDTWQSGGVIYAHGASQVAQVLLAYRPSIDGWCGPLMPMPHERYLGAVGVVDGRLYMFGGTNRTTTSSEFTPPIPPDTTPPRVACSAEPAVLWPPDNTLVPVKVNVEVTDDLSGAGGFSLVGAIANEGDATRDIVGFAVGTADTAGQLRASRNGRGNGRIYQLTYEGRDAAGNSAACSAAVTVPHDRRR